MQSSNIQAPTVVAGHVVLHDMTTATANLPVVKPETWVRCLLSFNKGNWKLGMAHARLGKAFGVKVVQAD